MHGYVSQYSPDTSIFSNNDFVIEGNDLGKYKPIGIYIDKYGIQFVFHFSNKYGASLVQSKFSQGTKMYTWEIAVLDKNGDVTYKTPVTDGVIGYLDGKDIYNILKEIDNLEEEKHEDT